MLDVVFRSAAALTRDLNAGRTGSLDLIEHCIARGAPLTARAPAAYRGERYMAYR